ncbi:hypothetical protein [Hymenobacter fodinae]|nr:hypothetical protein [Hymenobacter fodinae]
MSITYRPIFKAFYALYGDSDVGYVPNHYVQPGYVASGYVS